MSSEEDELAQAIDNDPVDPKWTDFAHELTITMSEKLQPEVNSLEEVFKKRSYLPIKSGEKIPIVFERVFSTSDNFFRYN